MAQAVTAPLYRRIADDLLEKVRDGIYPVGTLMPGELELIDLYSSSRHTVREALRVLEDMGIVSRQRGRGTLVISPEARPAFVQSVTNPKELFSYPEDSSIRVTSETSINADTELAALLGTRVGTRWSRISGPRTFIDGNPLCWTDIYLLPEYAEIARQLSANSRPVYELIAETYGEEVQQMLIDVSAGELSGHKADALGVETGTASLCVVRRYVGNSGRIFEVSVSDHPAGTYSYSFEFNRGWKSADHWSWSK